jgi:hypothetical protein
MPETTDGATENGPMETGTTKFATAEKGKTGERNQCKCLKWLRPWQIDELY